MLPVIGRNLLESIALLGSVSRTLAEKCVAGIEADEERCRTYALSSPSIVTSLNPYIGYENAAKVVKQAMAEGKDLRTVVLELDLMSRGRCRQGARRARHDAWRRRRRVMHPIERLRWIARAEDEPAASLGSEAAWTLAELAEQEPNALLTACRRLLDRHPACGPLWWVSARLATAADPLEEGRRAAAELCSDSTSDRIGRQLRDLVHGERRPRAHEPDRAVAAGARSLQALPAPPRGEPPGRSRRSMRDLSVVVSSEVTGWSSDEADDALEGAAVLLVEVLAAGRHAVLVSRGTAAVVQSARAAGVPAWAVIGVGRALPERLFEAARERAADEVDEVALEGFALAIGPELTGDPAVVAAQVTCPPGLELIRRSI